MMLSSVHRVLWQRLPRRARRAALMEATRRLAPRPDRSAQPAEPIIVAGALRSSTGLGQSARLCYRALETAGYDVRGIDMSALFMQPTDLPGFAYRDGTGLEGSGTLILHVNSPFLPLALWSLGKSVVRGKWVVGYWAWELPRVPADWNVGAPFVHEVWVPSRFTADAVVSRLTIEKLAVVPHPVAVERPCSGERRGDAALAVLAIADAASSMARKNPFAAVSAFKSAFGASPDARLSVKLNHPDTFPEGERELRQLIGDAPNIALLTEALTADEMGQLYAKADCILSLHRAEGFGLVIAEAMLRGLPAVSTDWSGPTDFLTADRGVPVPYRLVPARDPQGSYDDPEQLWADCDIAAAAKALVDLADPVRRSAIGDAARRFAEEFFSPERYAAAVTGRLELEPHG
jgi:glycosyltransferase involved in cell wall biosynthesis